MGNAVKVAAAVAGSRHQWAMETQKSRHRARGMGLSEVDSDVIFLAIGDSFPVISFVPLYRDPKSNDNIVYVWDGDDLVPMRIGRYLSSVLREALAISGRGDIYPVGDDMVAKAVDEYMSMVAPLQIMYAVSGPEIAQAYLHGPRSCMQYRSLMQWAHPYGKDSDIREYHPSEVYAYPHGRDEMGCQDDNGIYLAYVSTRKEKYAARALVRHMVQDGQEVKMFFRVYGIVERMQHALVEAGYISDMYMMEGARVARIKVALSATEAYPRGRRYLAPYIDGAVHCGRATVRGADWFEVVEDGSMNFRTTRGASAY